MKSLISLGRADTFDDSEEYEVVNLSDKGVTFRTPENELVWMDIDDVLGGLIDGVLIPQDGDAESPGDVQRTASDLFAVMCHLSVDKP
jgi:hypothetical protein